MRGKNKCKRAFGFRSGRKL